MWNCSTLLASSKHLKKGITLIKNVVYSTLLATFAYFEFVCILHIQYAKICKNMQHANFFAISSAVQANYHQTEVMGWKYA
jgi:hypothetical protein